MKKLYWIIGILFLLIGAAGIYLYTALQKIEYDYKISGYTISDINLIEGTGTLSLNLLIVLKSTLFFNVPVNFLYYEIYYKDNIVGKSNDVTGFLINKRPYPTEISQSVSVFINKQSIQIAKNYLTKTPTDLKIMVIINVFGLNINLKKVSITL